MSGRSLFYCQICQKSMDQNCKSSHLNGKKHLKRGIKSNQMDVPDGYYYCYVCDKLTGDKETYHLQSEKHGKNVKRKIAKKQESQRLQMEEKQRKIAHANLLKNRVIRIDSTGVSKERFVAIGNDTRFCAKEEIVAAKSLQRVKDTGIIMPAWDDTPIDREINANSWVTPAEVEFASGQWDARSIAHEIDTQWGSMPRGGAFSDSNHYYGPGDYDFY